MASRLYKAQGVVLRRRPLGEADDVVAFCSPTRGRFDAVARGIRKSKRSAPGRLEPFTEVHLLVAHGRTLDVISQAQVVRARPALVRDLDRLARGLYVLELYEGTAHEDAAEPSGHVAEVAASVVFRSLVRALDELENAAADADLVCRRAELRLLTVLGFAPQIDACVRCGASSSLVSFSLQDGGMVCKACTADVRHARRISVGCRDLLHALRLPPLEEAERRWRQIGPGVHREAEALLGAHLDWHCPARLRSRRFVESLRGLS